MEKGIDTIKFISTVALWLATLIALGSGSVFAATACEIDSESTPALNSITRKAAGAAALAKKAKANLISPKIVKGGSIVAGQYGDGALRKHGKTAAYYRSLAASYGLQAEAQSLAICFFDG